MSTVLMPQTHFCDFEYKSNGLASPDSTTAANLAVGSTVRLTLSRVTSSPATAAMILSNLSNLQNQHRRLERTQSAPAPNVQIPSAAISATTVNTSRYKTELCRPYEEFGVCKYGDKCQFAHGMNELRSLARHPKYKTELCRTFHTSGFCPYGPRCHFVHNQDEVLQKQPGVLTRSTSQQPSSNTRSIAISPSLSLDSPSSPCSLSSSLSQSPTGSMKFFGSESELHSPSAAIDEQRLPVFNRIATTAQILGLNDFLMQ